MRLRKHDFTVPMPCQPRNPIRSSPVIPHVSIQPSPHFPCRAAAPSRRAVHITQQRRIGGVVASGPKRHGRVRGCAVILVLNVARPLLVS